MNDPIKVELDPVHDKTDGQLKKKLRTSVLTKIYLINTVIIINLDIILNIQILKS